MRFSTPWGAAELVRFLSPSGDVVRTASASHGGEGVRTQVPIPAALADIGTVIGTWRWFEEDHAWSAVAMAFPHLYPTAQVEDAKSILRNRFPEAYSAHFGETLGPSDSQVLDQRAWERETIDSYCVIAGFSSNFWNVPEGQVYACGFRARDESVAGFLVPQEQYVNPMRLVLDPFPRWEPDRSKPYLKEAANAGA